MNIAMPPRRSGSVPLPTVLLAVLLPALVASCGPASPADQDALPATLLVAVDDLSWEDLLPAMNAGSAPQLLDLARRGSAYRLTAGSFATADELWLAMASGRPQPERSTPWAALAKKGLNPGLVGWPGSTTGPSSLIWSAAADLIREQDPRIMAVRHASPTPSIAALDEGIGRLRALMPVDADVMVVAPQLVIAAGPSIKARKPRLALPLAPGAIAVTGSPDHAGVLDILPSLLHLRRLPVPADLPGQVLDDLLVEEAG